MNFNDIKGQAKHKVCDMTEQAKAMAENSGCEMMKASKDWIECVQKKPLQSLLLGLAGFLLVRAIVKSN